VSVVGCAELGVSSEVGIEKEGYVEGAVFVITPSLDDWMGALSQPLPQEAVSESGRPCRKKSKAEEPVDPFARLTLTAHYKGVGPWRVSGHRDTGNGDAS
jgi:hypothetical protein